MKFISRSLTFCCAVNALFPAGAQQPAQVPSKSPAPTWYISDRVNLDRELGAVFWFKQQFVALGNEMQPGGRVGVVARSVKGEQWEFSHPAGAPGTEIFSAANNDKLLVVLPWDRISFLTSTDGTQWEKVDMPQNRVRGEQAMAQSVIWGNEEFIASGESGTILSSPDGKTWTVRRRAQAGEPHLFSVAWSGQYYVATYARDKVLRSSDGRDWKVVNAPGAPEKGFIGWVGKKFMIADSAARLFESDQGLNWSQPDTTFGCPGDNGPDIKKIFHAQNTVVVLGRCVGGASSPSRGMLAVSNDGGTSWINMSPSSYMRDISFSPELRRFVAAGYKQFPNGGTSYKTEAFARGDL